MFLFEKSLIQSTPLYPDTLVTVVLFELSREINLSELREICGKELLRLSLLFIQ